MRYVKAPDGTMWPIPDPDIEWSLRYASLDKREQLCAASILDAYRTLIGCTAKRRQEIVRALRAASTADEVRDE